jgi:hypothetical protein
LRCGQAGGDLSRGRSNVRASAEVCRASVTVAEVMKTVLTAARTSSMTVIVVVTWVVRPGRGCSN